MKIRFEAQPEPSNARRPLVRIARVFILLGVWFLVGLAGLCVWAKMIA